MPRRRAATRHNRWLSAVDVSGVVLSEPVLAEDSPAGFTPLEDQKVRAFRRAFERRRLHREVAPDAAERQWINFVLEDLLGLEERHWKVASEIPANLVSDLPVQGETLRPSRALFEGDGAVMLLKQVEPGQDLDRAEEGAAWRASPTTKIERLLRDTGVEVALLTNGEQWRLVVASPSEIASWITWTAQGWSDSLATLVAFVELFGVSRWFAGPREGTVIELVRGSRERQFDVADQLGAQARETLRLFVHELDRVDHTLDGALLAGMGEAEVYEAAAVFVMRLLFVMYAEENGLLPHGNVDWDRSYGALRLVSELEELQQT